MNPEFQNPDKGNTFRLQPKESDRFYPSKVKKIVMDIIKGRLEGQNYDHAQAKGWAEKIAEEIKNRVRESLSIPSYKIVVQTVIGQVKGQGVRVASKCLWDDQNDNYASFTYTN